MVVTPPTSPNEPSSLKFTSAAIICNSLSALISQPFEIQIVTLLETASFNVNQEALEFYIFPV